MADTPPSDGRRAGARRPEDLDAWLADGAADPHDDLDAGATLRLAEATVRRRRAAEVEDLLLCLRWADLHASDPRLDPEHRRPDGSPARFHVPGGERLVDVGGDGTPMVRELSLCELAVAREVHVLALRSVLADALDLRHRLPETWAVVRRLRCEPWLARRVASIARVLPADRVGVVDRAVADAIDGHAPSRVIALAEAKVVEADPAGHAERVREERERRYVTLTRRDLTGLRGIVARVEEGDAEWFAATLERVADILSRRAGHEETPRDHLRAEAMGWLARPGELLRLLVQHAHVPSPAPLTDERDWAAADDAPAPPAEPHRAWSLTADVLGSLDRVDLSVLRPRRTLYVHVGLDVLAGEADGVARAEGLGPVTLDRLGEVLGGGLADVTVTPVLDLADHLDTSSYEHSEAQRERIHLIHAGDAFPHASSRSRDPRRVDLDHPENWRAAGPPGQTSTRTSQPLGRTGHRAKTHLGWSCTPVRPGVTRWRSPHGLERVVDGAGTHRCDDDDPGATRPGRLRHVPGRRSTQ